MAGYVPKYLRVFLVDDHDIVRRGLRDLLAAATDIHVVGESGSARQAPRSILELGVDVMVLDLRLQDGTGVDVCREVRAVNHSVSGLLLTSSDDDEALMATILAGAAGYLVKLTNSSDIATAIRRVGTGRSLVDAGTAERAKQRLFAAMDELRPSPSETERRILTGVVAGLTNDEIAERTGLPPADTTAEVSALVRRFLRAGPGAVEPPITSPGKHRLDT